MAKSASDRIPVILLFTQAGSTRVFFKKHFGGDFYILEVDTSQEVLEKLSTTKVEVIILDDKLPIVLQELLQNIRALPSLKQTPILILSTNLKRAYMKEMIGSGATEFLREPLDKETIEQVMENAKQIQAVQEKVGPLAQSIAQRLPSLTGTPLSERPLTSARVSIRDAALKEIKKALQTKQSMSLLMVHVDQLDKVKMRWGDAALEELIEKVESALKRLLRPQDILIHPVRERFVILLPKTSEVAAKILAENLEEGVVNTKFTTQKGSVKLPVSIGVVTLSQQDMDRSDAYTHLEKMLKTGEAYLEKAKKIGKKIVSS